LTRTAALVGDESRHYCFDVDVMQAKDLPANISQLLLVHLTSCAVDGPNNEAQVRPPQGLNEVVELVERLPARSSENRNVLWPRQGGPERN
jgi:hypothetical protein